MRELKDYEVNEPRTVTVAEQLRKLAFGTIVIDKEGTAWQHAADEKWWATSTTTVALFSDELARRHGPISIIYDPSI